MAPDKKSKPLYKCYIHDCRLRENTAAAYWSRPELKELTTGRKENKIIINRYNI